MTRTIGSSADYRRDDFYFPRTQSREMFERSWERRGKPLHSRFSFSRLVDLALNTLDRMSARKRG